MWTRALDYRWQITAWIAYIFIGNMVTALSVIQEHARASLVVEPWEVFTWEFSSGVLILSLIPFIILYDRIFPIDFSQKITGLLTQIALHLPAAFVFSIAHVGGFILIRKWVYGMADRLYTFGDWPVEFIYELRKDIASYFTLLAIIYIYRELRRLKEGETKLSETEPQDTSSLKLIASKGNQKIVIAPEDIDSIEAAGNYVQLNVGLQSYLMRATMKNVAEQLKQFNFARIHRAHIVNEDRIKTATPKAHGGMLLELANGAKIECSRRYKQNLSSF